MSGLPCVEGCQCGRHRKTDHFKQRLSQSRTTHGLSRTSDYGRWYNMVARCHREDHPDYRNYGARGIQVCEEWQGNPIGLLNFIEYLNEELGPCPEGYSMDRIDNDGNYEPGNLIWASKSDQGLNRRK